MDKLTFFNIEKSISPERLAAYKADGASNEMALARYIYNIELSKSLYPIINIFEVTLRNSIDRALTEFCNVTDWNNVIPLTQTEQIMINEAKIKMEQRGKKFSHARLVSELTLGFWVALMGRKYNTQKFQFFIIKNIFYGCSSEQKSTAAVQKNLTEIRFLRNRIAHHERILHWTDLEQKHDLILDFIRWMSQDMHKIAIHNDTFETVYKNGIAPFELFIEKDFST